MIKAELKNVIGIFLKFKDDHYPDSAFIYGHERKVMERLQTLEREQYPVLHVERFFVITEDNNSGDQKEVFICTINAFEKYSELGTTDENDLSEIVAEGKTLRMLQDLQKELNHANYEGEIEFELNGVEKNPIQDSYVQYHTGWQMVVKIGLSAAKFVC